MLGDTFSGLSKARAPLVHKTQHKQNTIISEKSRPLLRNFKFGCRRGSVPYLRNVNLGVPSRLSFLFCCHISLHKLWSIPVIIASTSKYGIRSRAHTPAVSSGRISHYYLFIYFPPISSFTTESFSALSFSAAPARKTPESDSNYNYFCPPEWKGSLEKGQGLKKSGRRPDCRPHRPPSLFMRGWAPHILYITYTGISYTLVWYIPGTPFLFF